jgi:hypothetical protein
MGMEFEDLITVFPVKFPYCFCAAGSASCRRFQKWQGILQWSDAENQSDPIARATNVISN